MSVSIAKRVSIQDLKESFQAPFREADLKAFTLELDFSACTTEEELEAAIRRAGVLIDRLTLIAVDMTARFELLERHLGIKRIEGYREFSQKVTTLRKVVATIVKLLQTEQIAGRMQAGLSPRSIAPARFPSALTMGLRELTSELPDLVTLSEGSSLLGLDEVILEALSASGDIPSDIVVGKRTFMRDALGFWLSHAKRERVKRL